VIDEATDVATILGVEPLLDAQVTEAVLRQYMPGHEVVHLATHGFLHSVPLLNGIVAYPPADNTASEDLGERGIELMPTGDDPLERSQGASPAGDDEGSLLPGGDDPLSRGDETVQARERAAKLMPAGDDPLSRGWDTLTDDMYFDDGFLTMSEVMGIPLDGCELVTLSCCHSAEGEIAPGEGVMGLSQGFIYAGARAVLASLTKVDDEATRRLMVEFYRNWCEEGLSKREALRRAKQALAADPQYAAPRFWAPFVLYGAE
jgi:CHAT domain-containing protein